MGLDMHLKKLSRKDYDSIDKKEFWYEEYDKSEELVYWRKKYDINLWFSNNTSIYEECSSEITKDKLEELVKWLMLQDLKEDANKIKEVINKTNFNNEVIFYKYYN